MQGFQAKKRLLRAFLPVPTYCIYTPYSSIPRFCIHSANRTRVRWLEAEHDNHYTTRRVARIWNGFFERVRKVQTTLTRIFIVLESVSHGLSENRDEISRKAQKFKGFFRPNSIRWSPKKKKRSSPKLRLIFRPNSEIQTFEGGLVSYGGAIFNFSQKIGLKSTKNVQFCILHKTMGGLEPPPPPLATLLYTTQLASTHLKNVVFKPNV